MCPWTSKIQSHYDGELPAEESSRFEAHIGQCESCSRELEQLRELSRRIVEVKSIVPSDIAMQRWRQSVRDIGLGSVLRFVRFVTGVAAAIMIGGGVWVYTHQTPQAKAAAPDPWEQVAILPPNESTVATMPTNGAAGEADLAEWIVTDLSSASVER